MPKIAQLRDSTKKGTCEKTLYTGLCLAHNPSDFAFGCDPTGRCHKREFLLKFSRDRRRWIVWLYQARKRYTGLNVLNYMVTSNHIHLLVFDNGGRNVIPDSIKLTAGRTGQEYNIRKNRKGAFWEDRYHATAVEKNRYLRQCITYIDMNYEGDLLALSLANHLPAGTADAHDCCVPDQNRHARS